jgi:hypothetical protein
MTQDTEDKEKRDIDNIEVPESEETNVSEVSEKVEKAHFPSPEIQTAEPEALQGWAMENVSAIEPYLGTDNTSLNEVTDVYVKQEQVDPNVEMVTAWFEHINARNIDIAHEITVGIEIARTVTSDYNQFYNLSQMTMAGRMILIGKVLLALKRLTRQAGYMWTRWAAIHMPFLKPRSRERAMLLAERKDCHLYLPLGAERLELLCQGTKGSKEKDPIGSLLRKYNILYGQDAEVTPAEFKALIDAALNAERLAQGGISVDFELVKRLTNLKVEVGSSLIKRLQETRESGGSVQRYLELLTLHGGKEMAASDSEKPLQDFKLLSSRLIKTLAEIQEDQIQPDKIDATLLTQLIEELQTLKSKLIGAQELTPIT